MNLIIDIGNTFTKLAVFNDDVLVSWTSVKQPKALGEVRRLLKTHKQVSKAIVSHVGRLEDDFLSAIPKKLELLELDHKTKLPFKNKYSTPKTLGVDRIALVSASVEKFPKNNVLIIDAGTCITYDFINTKNHYLGGAISPGIGLRYQALHNLTANLPLLKAKYPSDIIGDSTQESIHSGVVIGVLKEIDGVIDAYLQDYQDLTVILTGGDTDFLAKRLKNSIFANSNFLLEGLNFILEYNSH